MKIENSQKSILEMLFGTIYLAMRSNLNKSDKGTTYYNCKTFINHNQK